MEFGIVAHYQVWENYSFDDEGFVITGPEAHWKPKGSHDEVLGTTTLHSLNRENITKEAINKAQEMSNSVFEYQYCDWELVPYTSESLRDVCEFIAEVRGIHPENVLFFLQNATPFQLSELRFEYGWKHGTEHAFDWALQELGVNV